MNRLPALTAVFLVVTSFPLSADTHEAHVHGEAELSIVVDQTHLEILLSLPGMDFIGFEYEPVTDEERDLVHILVESIEEDPESYFILKTGLFSKLEPMHIHVSESEHHHDEGDHDDVGDENETHHNEYFIELEYRLEEGARARSFDLDNFFKEFPTVEAVDWILISDGRQSAGEATPRSSRISLKD